MKMGSWGLAALLSATAIASLAAQEIQQTRLALGKSAHGIEGWAVLRSDARITPATQNALQDFQWFGFGEPPAVTPPVTSVPLGEAELRVEDKAGREVATMPLGSPFAVLSAVTMVPESGPAFLIEVSNGGFGQFTGTVGRPFVVQGGRLRFLDATGSDGTTSDITLLRAPHTGWLVLPASGGRAGEFFQATCLPGEGGADGFAEALTAWRWDRDGWRRHQRTGRGYCNWAPGLPPLSAFP